MKWKMSAVGSPCQYWRSMSVARLLFLEGNGSEILRAGDNPVLTKLSEITLPSLREDIGGSLAGESVDKTVDCGGARLRAR